MTRGQLGDAVEAEGVDKRTFYKTQQERIAEFANKDITVRLLMQPARSLQLLSRLVSAEATSVPVQCT